MRPRIMILTIGLTIVLLGLLGSEQHRSSGQDPIRTQPACTIFCGDGSFNTIGLGVTPCWGGPLPAGKTGDHFKDLPEQTQDAICRNLATPGKNNPSCPAFKTLAGLCKDKKNLPKPGGTPPKDKCEPPTPWFGSSSDCKDLQSPEITGNDPLRVVTLSICGIEVFHHVVPKDHFGGVDAYKLALGYFVRKRVGSKICCDKLREAARTGMPCDPIKTNDIDCDGKSNQADWDSTKFRGFPDINNLFSSPEGAPIDPFPAGLNPDDPGFLPPQDKCDCKWALVKGTLHCSPDGKQKHFYEAFWRCPSTGNERSTRKYAAATEECP